MLYNTSNFVFNRLYYATIQINFIQTRNIPPFSRYVYSNDPRPFNAIYIRMCGEKKSARVCECVTVCWKRRGKCYSERSLVCQNEKTARGCCGVRGEKEVHSYEGRACKGLKSTLCTVQLCTGNARLCFFTSILRVTKKYAFRSDG